MTFVGRRSRLSPGVRPIAVAFGAASLILVASASGQAQPSRNAPSQAQPSTTAPNQAAAPAITDQKIDATAQAMVQVSSLRQSYNQKIAAAPDSDKPRLASEAGDAMKKAVTDHGLTVAEYNAIVDRAKTDPDLRNKIVQRLPPDAKK